MRNILAMQNLFISRQHSRPVAGGRRPPTDLMCSGLLIMGLRTSTQCPQAKQLVQLSIVSANYATHPFSTRVRINQLTHPFTTRVQIHRLARLTSIRVRFNYQSRTTNIQPHGNYFLPRQRNNCV